MGGQRLFTKTVKHVLQGQHRVTIEHPGARIPHHSPDLLSRFWLVAVNGAFGAGGLALLEWAPLEALLGIVAQSLAFST